MDEKDKELYDKAYSYFEYHAGQRTTMINFFLVVLAACIAFYGELISSNAFLCSLISGFLFVITLIFYLIDLRNTFDVKQSQAVLCELEKSFGANKSNPVAQGVFSNEDNWYKKADETIAEYLKKEFDYKYKKIEKDGKTQYKIRLLPRLSSCIHAFYYFCMALSLGGLVFAIILLH